MTSAVNRQAVLAAIKQAEKEQTPITGCSARRQALSVLRFLGIHHCYRAKIEELLAALKSEGIVRVCDATLVAVDSGSQVIHSSAHTADKKALSRRKTRRPGRRHLGNDTTTAYAEEEVPPADVLERYAAVPLPRGWETLSPDASAANPEVLGLVAARCSCEQLADYLRTLTRPEVRRMTEALSVEQIDGIADILSM